MQGNFSATDKKIWDLCWRNVKMALYQRGNVSEGIASCYSSEDSALTFQRQ